MLQYNINNFKDYIVKNTCFVDSELEEILTFFNTKKKQDLLKDIVTYAKNSKATIKLQIHLIVTECIQLEVKFCFVNESDFKNVTDTISKCKRNLFLDDVRLSVGYTSNDIYNALRCTELTNSRGVLNEI